MMVAPHVKVFINLTSDLILSDYFFPLDPNRIVIEILEDAVVNQQLIDKIKELRVKGYHFALDDYLFEPRFDPLLPLVDYIKIDLMGTSKNKLQENFEKLKKLLLEERDKLPLLLAEKVENKEEYDVCIGLGFDLFQGYYLEKPQLVYGKKISQSSQNALHIVAKMQEDDVDIDSLCHIISQDAKLSYQLLKIVNSPLCRVPKKVSSLKETVVFLGLEQVKKWGMALVMSGNSGAKSPELFRILMTRARTCELYAISQKYDKPESYFMVGLFSGIDAVMLADKQWLIGKLELVEDINQALLYEKGPKGLVLKMVIALEHAEWAKTNELTDEQQIDLFAAHEESINWAHQLCNMI